MSLVEPLVPSGTRPGSEPPKCTHFGFDLGDLLHARAGFRCRQKACWKRSGASLTFCDQLVGLRRAQAQRFHLFVADQQPGEPSAIAVGDCPHNFGAHFFGRDHLPGIDLAVFVRVDSPAAAGRVQPAVLVGFAVEIAIDVAIDLEPVAEIAPLIDDVIAVGVDEASQDLAVGVADDPAGVAAELLGLDRAFSKCRRPLDGRIRRPSAPVSASRRLRRSASPPDTHSRQRSQAKT